MQTHEHHDMAHGSDHAAPATVDPHAGHAAPAGHGGHDAHAGDGGHDKHEGHSVAMFRDRFWLSLLLSVPVLIWSEMLQDLLGYTAPSMPAQDLDPARVRQRGVRLRRVALPQGRVAGTARPHARHDAAHLPRDHGGVRVEPRERRRVARPRLLVGARAADRRDAARALAGDEGHRTGVERPRRARRAAARHGRTRRGCGHRRGGHRRSAPGRSGVGAPRRPSAGRWHDRDRLGRVGRVDDHRRVEGGRARAR